MNKIAVYTCITGNYDNLLEISEKSDKIDYICFTDNKNLKSASWKIKYFSEIDGFGILKNEITTVKKQRLIKILSHKFLSEYDTTLWVDANIKIQHNLYNFITSFDLEKCPIYTNKHPTRNCLYQEVLAVVKLKKDKYENIRPQVLRYKSEKYPVNNGMAETNIILRNNKDLRNHLLELKWAKEILQGSHRDQLSFNYVIWKNKLSYSHLNIQYRFTKENDLFHLVKHNKSALPYSQDFIKTTSEIQQEKNNKNSFQDLIYKQINDFKFEKTSNELPILNVVMTTHNRTGVACYCIDALVKNLKYSGKIQYIICDDRSDPGHCEALEYQFKQCGIFDVIILKTDENRYGLGASLNNGLYNSFERSDIVLTTEDDWLLVKELNMDLYVKTIIENNDIGGIRLATTSHNSKCLHSYTSLFYKFMKDAGNTSFTINNCWIYNNQVMLRHKRVYDKLGYYKENCNADEQERKFSIKFNQYTNFGKNEFKVLYPRCLNLKSELFGDKNYFHHIGLSTLPRKDKFRYIKNEYIKINSIELSKTLQNLFIGNNTNNIKEIFNKIIRKSVFFKIIIPVYNSGKLLQRAVNSVLNQTFTNYKIIIVDDNSTDNSKNIINSFNSNKIEKIFLSENRYGGGARNAAINLNIESEYILYLDSDDYFYDNNVLTNIYNSILTNNYPDLLKLSYCKIKNNKLISNHIYKYDNNIIYNAANFAAPWTSCIKSDKNQKFIENRYRFNDVVWNFRVCDACDTFAVCENICIAYTLDENKVSVQHGEKNEKYFESLKLLVDDLKKETFKKEDCNIIKNKIMNNKLLEYKKYLINKYKAAYDYAKNKQKLNIDNPSTIQDKIAWLKVFDNSILKTKCADKIKVHDYCKEKLGVDICPSILKIYKSVDEINLDELPEKFVLKCNHGCKFNIIIKNKNNINLNEIKNKLNKWLNTDYSIETTEMQYHDIIPTCYAEEFIDSKCDDITDYKFICFNGKPTYCQIINNRSTNNKQLNYYDMNFNFVDICRLEFPNNSNNLDNKPKHWNQMIEYAKILSQDFKFVRVDFYEENDKVYLGELTFTPGNATMKYKNPTHAKMLGDMLQLED